MTRLTYPKLPAGYEWNLKNKIRMAINYDCGISHTANNTYIRFEEDLNQSEIDIVDAIMASPETAQNAVQFTEPDNHYVIKDIWEWRGELETVTGINFAITYRSSGTFGPNIYDEIVIQPVDSTYQNERILTNPEKNTVANTIRSQMGGWE